MNNAQKQEANIAAAKLLGLEYSAKTIHKTNNGTWHIDMNLDIFTSPADCLAVVKKLGEDKHCSVFYGDGGWTYWISPLGTRDMLKPVGKMLERIEHRTHEEAVAAACLEIGGKDE